MFIMATNVLAQHTSSTKQELRGLSISMNGKMKRSKLAQYADDTILFLRNTDDVLLVTKILNEFKSVAGLTLNLDKTEALHIADDFENVSTIHGIACNINGVKRCLSVHVGHNQALCDTLNWEKKLLEIEWKKRDLTLFGEITIIKMLAIPKLILIAQTTAHKKTQLKRLCFTFTWGKRDRTRSNTLIAPVSKGGLNMLDIESFFLALKAAWFKRIILNNENWSLIPRNMFRFCDNLKLLLQMHFISKLIKNNKLSTFFCQILDAYMLTNEAQNDNSQILCEN